MDTTPRWLRRAERYLGWLSIPNIGLLFVTLQALGFLMVSYDPQWSMRLALIPQAVMQGEVWRLITFLSLPLSMSPLWVIITLWFLYSILGWIETEWGSFQTTFYFLTSFVAMIAVSFALGIPVFSVRDFETTLFLAAAALYPEMEVRLFLAIPVKMKWLGWLSLALAAWSFIQNGWEGRIFLIAVYSNYLIFFGPGLIARLKQEARRRDFQRKMRR